MFKRTLLILGSSLGLVACAGCDCTTVLYTLGALGGIAELIHVTASLFGVTTTGKPAVIGRHKAFFCSIIYSKVKRRLSFYIIIGPFLNYLKTADFLSRKVDEPLRACYNIIIVS